MWPKHFPSLSAARRMSATRRQATYYVDVEANGDAVATFAHALWRATAAASNLDVAPQPTVAELAPALALFQRLRTHRAPGRCTGASSPRSLSVLEMEACL